MEEVRAEQVVKARPVCPVCGATFKDGRGLNGHMAGKHGQKYGLNATLDDLVRVIDGMRHEMISLTNAVSGRDVMGARCIEVAQMLSGGRCVGDARVKALRAEWEMLKELYSGARKGGGR